jgi:hypothetical protein
MIGDALVGVALVRNIFGVVVSLVVIPWTRGMGLQNTFILTAGIVGLVLSIPVLLMRWGRGMRVRTSLRYEHYSLAAIPPFSLKKLMRERCL